MGTAAGAAKSRERSSMHRRWTGSIVTADLIIYVKRWVQRRSGFEPSLVIERVGDRNKVLLRISIDGRIHEAEVACLNGMRKDNPNVPAERILALFREAK